MHVTRRAATRTETVKANRAWWDAESDAYQAEHGDFLGATDFVWGPEGVSESDLGLLGDVAGRRILEIGCGAGQCGRWLREHGADAVGLELSGRQLDHARRLNRETGVTLPVVLGDAQAMPFGDRSFDIVCSAYGVFPFVADHEAVLSEAARVLRPDGMLVFSTTHPTRWSYLDDPGDAGLVAVHSYFDRRAYVEQTPGGEAQYVEHHRTVGDWVRAIVTYGFTLIDLVEPEWLPENPRAWGGWSPLRGRLIPGTAIFCCRRRR